METNFTADAVASESVVTNVSYIDDVTVGMVLTSSGVTFTGNPVIVTSVDTGTSTIGFSVPLSSAGTGVDFTASTGIELASNQYVDVTGIVSAETPSLEMEAKANISSGSVSTLSVSDVSSLSTSSRATVKVVADLDQGYPSTLCSSASCGVTSNKSEITVSNSELATRISLSVVALSSLTTSNAIMESRSKVKTSNSRSSLEGSNSLLAQSSRITITQA